MGIRERRFLMQELRSQLVYVLSGGGAHLGFEALVAEFPFSRLGLKPDRLAHTVWQLVYHITIAQWDILEFIRNPRHVSPAFPDGYWPEAAAPAGEEEWRELLERYRGDLAALKHLAVDPDSDLLAAVPYGSGQSLLREILLASDHTAYHLGQVADIRRLLDVPA
jgi:hypothetical protein